MDPRATSPAPVEGGQVYRQPRKRPSHRPRHRLLRRSWTPTCCPTSPSYGERRPLPNNASCAVHSVVTTLISRTTGAGTRGPRWTSLHSDKANRSPRCTPWTDALLLVLACGPAATSPATVEAAGPGRSGGMQVPQPGSHRHRSRNSDTPLVVPTRRGACATSADVCQRDWDHYPEEKQCGYRYSELSGLPLQELLHPRGPRKQLA